MQKLKGAEKGNRVSSVSPRTWNRADWKWLHAEAHLSIIRENIQICTVAIFIFYPLDSYHQPFKKILNRVKLFDWPHAAWSKQLPNPRLMKFLVAASHSRHIDRNQAITPPSPSSPQFLGLHSPVHLPDPLLSPLLGE